MAIFANYRACSTTPVQRHSPHERIITFILSSIEQESSDPRNPARFSRLSRHVGAEPAAIRVVSRYPPPALNQTSAGPAAEDVALTGGLAGSIRGGGLPAQRASSCSPGVICVIRRNLQRLAATGRNSLRLRQRLVRQREDANGALEEIRPQPRSRSRSARSLPLDKPSRAAADQSPADGPRPLALPTIHD